MKPYHISAILLSFLLISCFLSSGGGADFVQNPFSVTGEIYRNDPSPDSPSLVKPFEKFAPSHTFPLKYSKSGGSLEMTVLIEQDNIKRGDDVILKGSLILRKGKNVSFQWNRKKRTLILDLNQNSDLRDDAEKIFRTDDDSFDQTFQNIPFSIMVSGKQLECHVDITIKQHIPQPYAKIRVRSSWQGEIILDDRKYKMIVTDNLNGEINRNEKCEDKFRIVPCFDPPPSDSLPFEQDFPVQKFFFLNGKMYETRYEFENTGNETILLVTFLERKATKQDAGITGKNVRRLILRGMISIIYDDPPPRIALPVGEYNRLEAVLGTPDFKKTAFTDIHGKTIIDRENFLKLEIGSPLHNRVRVIKISPLVLQVSQSAWDDGGHRYRIFPVGSDNPLRFSVNYGDQLVAEENFRMSLDSGQSHPFSWRVPGGISGMIEIRSTMDLGDLGSGESKPVIYHWKPPSPLLVIPVIIPFIAWLVAFVISLFRDRRSGIILIPAVIQILVFLFFSRRHYDLDPIFFYTGLSLSLVWLSLPYLAKKSRFTIFLIVSSILIVMGYFPVMFINHKFRPVRFPLIFSMFFSSCLLSFILVSVMNRKKFRYGYYYAGIFVSMEIVFVLTAVIHRYIHPLFLMKGYLAFSRALEMNKLFLLLFLTIFLPALLLPPISRMYRKSLEGVLKIPEK